MLNLFGKKYFSYEEMREMLQKQRDIETDLFIGTMKEIQWNCFDSEEAREKAHKYATFHETRMGLLNQLLTELWKMEKRA